MLPLLSAFFLIGAEAPVNAQVDTFLHVTNAAANATDRWLMMAAFIALLMFMGWVIRDKSKDKESARAEHATAIKDAYAQVAVARQEHNVIMEKMYGEQTKLAAELVIALQQNKELMEKVKSALERIAMK